MKKEIIHTPLFFVIREFNAAKKFMRLVSTREDSDYCIEIDDNGAPIKSTANDIMIQYFGFNLRRYAPTLISWNESFRADVEKLLKIIGGEAMAQHEFGLNDEAFTVYHEVVKNRLFFGHSPYYHNITAWTGKPVEDDEKGGIVIPFALKCNRNLFDAMHFGSPDAYHVYEHCFTCYGEMIITRDKFGGFSARESVTKIVYNKQKCAVLPFMDKIADNVVHLAILAAAAYRDNDRLCGEHAIHDVEIHKLYPTMEDFMPFIEKIEKKLAA